MDGSMDGSMDERRNPISRPGGRGSVVRAARMRTVVRVARMLTVVSAWVLAWAPIAWAHPHVWIDAVAELMFDDAERLRGVRVYWAFDEMYSAFATEGLDADGDGTVSAEELAPLAETNVRELREWGYFTVVEVDGRPVDLGEVREFGMRSVGGRLAMWMHLPLAAPVDPRAGDVAIAMYDPTFYIAIDLLRNQPVRVNGTMPSACHFAVVEPEESVDDLQMQPESFFQTLDPASGRAAAYARSIRLRCRPAG
jgi:ABC-type uncharacterized transport system substrate-binding protein